MNNINDKGKRNCTGCGVCEIACPTNAISITLGELGFYVPHINEDLCTHCTMCKKACYKFANLDNENNLLNNKFKTYSAYTSNATIRMMSSSGGISYELGSHFIDNGKHVAGVSFNYKHNRTNHVIAKNKKDLLQLTGSKYLQSYTIDAFRKLKNGDIVFGTPCQIFGLRKLNELKDKKDLLFIDLYCHGVPSYNLWKVYLKNIKRKYGVGIIEKVNFRDKSNTGWHNYSMTINGSKYNYTKEHNNDLFFKIFLNNSCLNQACYNCVFRKNYVPSDIRIGDFWGKKYLNNENGITIITANKIGQDVLDKLKEKINIEAVSKEELIDSQNKGSIKLPANYAKSIKSIDKKSFFSLMLFYYFIPYIKKNRKHPKQLIKLFIPKKIVNLIKA